jgi:hypothetical protein
MVKLAQAPGLLFIVIVCPVRMVILSPATGTPTGDQVAAVAQFPVPVLTLLVAETRKE